MKSDRMMCIEGLDTAHSLQPGGIALSRAEHVGSASWGKSTHTSFLLHFSALETFVEKSDAESNIDTHSFFVDHARHAVLHEYVGTVGTQAVATV